MSVFDDAVNRMDERLFRLFGVDVEIQSTTEVVQGVINTPSSMEDIADYEIDFSRPSLTVRATDADKIADNEMLIIETIAFTVAGRATDGSGLVILGLA